jgi:YD repeat-containing protein
VEEILGSLSLDEQGSRWRLVRRTFLASEFGARAWISLCAVAVCVLVVAGHACAQPAKTFYFYDELSRLTTVVDQQGNVATYTYDAVGNLLRIDRIDSAASPGQVGITLVTPNQGTAGTTVQIFGKGLSMTPAQNAVTFNGTPATVTDAAPNRIVVTVPAAARTGLITVTTPQGSAASPMQFTVIGLLTISPPGEVVIVGGSRQFRAADSVNPGAVFAWSVNGIAGGSLTVGTVTSAGLYTAPASVPTPPAVILTAVENGVTGASASAQALIVGTPLPAMASARSVSALPQAASSSPATSSASPVSARVQAAASPATAIAPAAGVAVSLEPFISRASPTSASPGSADLAVTLVGSGFSGATGVTFLRNGVADNTITATNLIVDAGGTRATVTISVAAGASAGGRVIRVTVPGRTSTAAGLDGNVFIVN